MKISTINASKQNKQKTKNINFAAKHTFINAEACDKNTMRFLHEQSLGNRLIKRLFHFIGYNPTKKPYEPTVVIKNELDFLDVT